MNFLLPRFSALPTVLFLALAPLSNAQEWQLPSIKLPSSAAHPMLACTPEELGRLKAAYASNGSEHKPVAAIISKADAAMDRPLTFPPRGGQHNQWYQCEVCQLGLKRIDDTHHQCPHCKKIYSGPPYDDVVFTRIHWENLKAMEATAWAYAVTGKRPYAEFSAKVLLGYAQRYRAYPFHDSKKGEGPKAKKSGGHLFEQTLTEAQSLAECIAPAYDLIFDSGVLSADDHRAIREGLLVPMLTTIDGWKAGKSNWQSWHNAAMLWGGALIKDPSFVKKALADPSNGFVFQMKTGVTSDGMWHENSWGYHFYTLRAMVDLAEGARRLGFDIWSNPSLKKMFLVPVRYSMADGSLPRFGDDVRTSVSYGSASLEAAYHAYKDPNIAALLSSKKTWESVLLGRTSSAKTRPRVEGSEIFPGAGHAILRTHGDAGLTAALTFGPYAGSHGHFDKLSFVLFGYGKEIGVDPGRAASQAYRLDIHKNWYKATLGHNAVVVDGKSQEPATGELELFASTPTHAAVVVRCDAAYPGTSHRRVLLLTPTYALVVDDLSSKSEHRFDWLVHDRADSARMTPAGAAADPASLPFAGREYLRNLISTKTDRPIRVDFASKPLTTRVTLAPAPQTQAQTADGPGESVLDRVPLLIATRVGGSALFAATIEPVKTGQQPQVGSIFAERTASGIRVTVQNGATSDVLTLSPDLKLTVSSGKTTVLTGTSQKH